MTLAVCPLHTSSAVPLLCMSAYVCEHMFMYVCLEARGQQQVILHHFPPYTFIQHLFLSLRLTRSARLADQQALGIPYLPPVRGIIGKHHCTWHLMWVLEI